AADTRVNEPLVSAATLEQVAKLRLTDQGRTVSVDRQPEGAWIVTSYHDLPADFSKLQSFVGNLAEAKIQRLVASNPERSGRLEFKDTKIELLDAAGKALVSLTLGRHADTGGGRFVRFGSEDKAYLANLSAWLDTESRNWADSALVTLAPDDVNRIEIPLVEG